MVKQSYNIFDYHSPLTELRPFERVSVFFVSTLFYESLARVRTLVRVRPTLADRYQHELYNFLPMYFINTQFKHRAVQRITKPLGQLLVLKNFVVIADWLREVTH